MNVNYGEKCKLIPIVLVNAMVYDQNQNPKRKILFRYKFCLRRICQS